MSENIIYKLDLDKIYKDFAFNNGVTHSQCKEFKLLPFVANESTLFTDFEGVVGAFSRLVCDKKLESNFNAEEFIENVAEEIGEFEGATSKESFKHIVKSMFLDDDKLVDFDLKTINYISSTTAEEKTGKFIYSIFSNNEVKELAEKYYERDIKNILYKLVIKALPELKSKKANDENYKCYLPFVKELFIKDYKFLISNQELYKDNIRRFLEFYYLFYISQLSIKLCQFEKANLNKPDPVYMTLSWESLSKNRTAYIYGWEQLKIYVNSLFSHAITLEFLNHNDIDEQLGYVELFDVFKSDEGIISNDIEELISQYTEKRKEVSWNKFEFKHPSSGSTTFDEVYKLFEIIEYQFRDKQSKRKDADKKYSNWFIKFVQDNFGKRRGSLGYSLSFTEEDIILLTKICINNNEKLKLSVLFEEFEKRGVFFDRDSSSKIIQLYEKLNLLEKKSDSGDAQYVRSIL